MDLTLDERILILTALEERLRTQVRATHIYIQDGLIGSREKYAAAAAETLGVMRKFDAELSRLNINRVAAEFPEAFAFVERIAQEGR